MLDPIKRLRNKADKLYQVKLIEKKPRSVVSGEPTEVIHHYIRKSQSNNLRYDYENGIPLTNKEHCQLHLSGDPDIIARILKANGQEWHDDLQARRRIPQKLNKSYLEEKINELNSL